MGQSFSYKPIQIGVCCYSDYGAGQVDLLPDLYSYFPFCLIKRSLPSASLRNITSNSLADSMGGSHSGN